MSVNNFETIYYDLFKQHYSALLFYAYIKVVEIDFKIYLCDKYQI